MSDEPMTDVERAEALGRLYAHGGLSLSECPYPWDGDPDTQVCRWAFGMAYADAGGIKLPRWEAVRERVRRAWYGNEAPTVQE